MSILGCGEVGIAGLAVKHGHEGNYLVQILKIVLVILDLGTVDGLETLAVSCTAVHEIGVDVFLCLLGSLLDILAGLGLDDRIYVGGAVQIVLEQGIAYGIIIGLALVSL